MKPGRYLLILGCYLTAVCLHASDDAVTSGPAWHLPPVTVIDEAGKPVAGAQVAAVMKSWPLNAFWVKETDLNGQVVFADTDYAYSGLEDPRGIRNLEILALAKGLAPAIAEWANPTSGPLTLQVGPGVPIDVTLKAPEDHPMPENLVPLVYPPLFGMAFHHDDTPGEVKRWAEKLEPGKFRIHIKESQSTQPLVLEVLHQDYLLGYFRDVDTTGALESGKLEFSLPAPAELNITIKNRAGEEAEPGLIIYAPALIKPLVSSLLRVSSDDIPLGSDDIELQLPMALPVEMPQIGEKAISVQLYEKGREGSARDNFNRVQSLDDWNGETTTVEFQYRKFDESVFQGENVLRLSLKRQSGSPVSGAKIRVAGYHPDFLGASHVVATGAVDDNGTTVISGLSSELSFRVWLADGKQTSLGSPFRFNQASSSFTRELVLPPGVMDQAPDVSFLNLQTSQPVKLSSFRGQVVFLDFWATWCGPCQGPMAHNEAIGKKNAAAWQDKAVILAASIEDDSALVASHIQKNDWHHMVHVRCDAGVEGGSADKVFQVTGIPAAFLIDQNGKIVWSGHPAELDVEAEINKLLQ